MTDNVKQKYEEFIGPHPKDYVGHIYSPTSTILYNPRYSFCSFIAFSDLFGLISYVHLFPQFHPYKMADAMTLKTELKKILQGG